MKIIEIEVHGEEEALKVTVLEVELRVTAQRAVILIDTVDECNQTIKFLNLFFNPRLLTSSLKPQIDNISQLTLLWVCVFMNICCRLTV